jgi:hypothetical protein
MRDREMDPWLELAERAEKEPATRDLDAAVYERLGLQTRPQQWRIHADLPFYTSSVDAVLSLIDEAFPIAYWTVRSPEPIQDNKAVASIWRGPSRSNGCAKTPALALLSAYCRARSTLSSALAKEEGSASQDHG